MGTILTATRVKIDLNKRQASFLKPFLQKAQMKVLAFNLSVALAKHCQQSDLILEVRGNKLYSLEGTVRSVEDIPYHAFFPGRESFRDTKFCKSAEILMDKKRTAHYGLNTIWEDECKLIPRTGNIPSFLEKAGVTEMGILRGMGRRSIERMLSVIFTENLSDTWKTFQKKGIRLEIEKMNSLDNSLNAYSSLLSLIREHLLPSSMVANFVSRHTKVKLFNPEQDKLRLIVTLRKDSMMRDYAVYRIDTENYPDVSKWNAGSIINIFNSDDKIRDILDKFNRNYQKEFRKCMKDQQPIKES